jgi:hypothetical protein
LPEIKIDKKPRWREVFAMAVTDDDVITSWRDRVGKRKRGRIGAAALTVVPASEIDVRRGRPPAPERLSDEERALWEKLTFSRRPRVVRGCRIASRELCDDNAALSAA